MHQYQYVSRREEECMAAEYKVVRFKCIDLSQPRYRLNIGPCKYSWPEVTAIYIGQQRGRAFMIKLRCSLKLSGIAAQPAFPHGSPSAFCAMRSRNACDPTIFLHI